MRWLLALWLAVAPAWAQEPIIGSGVYAAKSTAATYTGPGDIVSGASVWYGLRAYSAAIVTTGTQKIVNARNAATSETCDIIVSASGGLGLTANCSGASSGTAAATFCAASGGPCDIVTWYDQSGGGFDVTQATAASQPQLTFSCIGSLPCADFTTSGSSQFLSGAGPSLTGADSFSVVYNWITTGATTRPFISTSTSANFFRTGSSAGATVDVCGGSCVSGASTTNNAWDNGQAVINGASSFININGTQTTGTATARSTSGNINICSASGGGSNCRNKQNEQGIWGNLAWTNTQANNMCHNQFTYWGTSTSC